MIVARRPNAVIPFFNEDGPDSGDERSFTSTRERHICAVGRLERFVTGRLSTDFDRGIHRLCMERIFIMIVRLKPLSRSQNQKPFGAAILGTT